NNTQREKLYDRFRRGELKRLVVSKVANFAIDLPDANVAIQVSGTFGSRQEEAQRLGRLLRPKADGGPAHFYTIVTRDTRDPNFSPNGRSALPGQAYLNSIERAEQEVLISSGTRPPSLAAGGPRQRRPPKPATWVPLKGGKWGPAAAGLPLCCGRSARH